MSAYYDLYETPSPNGSEEKKSLHARICPKETYTQKEFVEHVAMFQHLPKNIIGAALDALKVSYPNDYVKQMLEYSRDYSFLPNLN